MSTTDHRSARPLRKAGAKHPARDAARLHRAGIAPSQNQIAYESIKDAVVTLRLKPSEYVNCARLAKSFRLGRTPVMRALDRLMNEGLVHIIPRKGVAVAPLSLDEALSLIEVRRINEAYCLELAARRISADQLDDLERLLDQYDDAARDHDLAGLLRADRAFHETIAAASGNLVLANLLKVLHARAQRFWAMSLSHQPHIAEVAAEHREILRCLRRRDGAAARRAVEHHVESFRRNLLR